MPIKSFTATLSFIIEKFNNAISISSSNVFDVNLFWITTLLRYDLIKEKKTVEHFLCARVKVVRQVKI